MANSLWGRVCSCCCHRWGWWGWRWWGRVGREGLLLLLPLLGLAGVVVVCGEGGSAPAVLLLAMPCHATRAVGFMITTHVRCM